MNFDVRRSVLPYSPCRTCHSTATTMLFCILLLTTTPTFSAFSDISILESGNWGISSSGNWLTRSPNSPLRFLPHERFDACQIAADSSQTIGCFELAHRLLN